MRDPIATIVDVDSTEATTLSWGAVIAGAVAASAMTLVTLALGVGLGLSVVSPWSDQGVSASTFSVGAGLFMLATAMLSSLVGGCASNGSASTTMKRISATPRMGS